MSSPSPFSRLGSGEATRIATAPQAAASAAPPRSRRGGVALWVVAVLLVPLLALLVRYFTGFLGTAASFIGLLLAAIPFVIVWFAVRAIDRWEPEPRRLLVFAVAWGAIASIVIALGVDLVVTLVTGGVPPALSAVVQAPIVEELAKGLGVLLIFAFARRAFDGPVDGIVYGALIGAGFALTENVQYFAISYLEGGPAQVASTFFLRAVLSPFAHVMFTCLTGFAFGLAARRGLGAGAALRYGIPGVIGAIVLHALWNGSATFFDFFELYAALQVPLFLLFILGILALRREETRLTRARLGEYAAAGWFTPQEVDMLATGPGRRSAVAWSRTLPGDRSTVMKTFITDATALAAARQRSLSGRDPHAPATERYLLERTMAARAALLGP
ncbi:MULTISPECIES: PrsW family intramembrane metalloprotease [Microbacterium]|uniref:PrsW family intramembrane metalloprotease n=1 Tax=Microbacterium TaxID=33882 RepID=UPI00277D599B|nr:MULTISPECIES: PrsW family intramembrane metalloprotease [Microbacterium]MDQ1083469.1 RsiW-degrading membrane proteinase PrsW (M82 family) [Microbacterium sp. SORGH_AS_0344]MDQ1171251.1 RsiW-degrading membrane proteinase PrsW (M82 family) [Microbacterium proteolyticum]